MHVILPTFLVASNAEQLGLPLAMLVIFGSAKLLDEIFERLHQPGIVGQILAGILIGPSVLVWMAPTVFLSRLAELGVMFLLFRVGMEVTSSDLMKAGPRATLVAMLGVIVPFFAGWGLLSLWGESRIESIFVGAALVATSVGITAQVLAAKNLLHEQASQIILGAAVIDDILGLLVLALVSSVAKGAVNVLELGLTALFAVGFTLVVVKWGAAAMGRVLPRLNQQLRAGESQFSAAVVLMFALSVLSVYAGVAAIIGAFFAGMMLSDNVEERVHDLTQGVTEFLLPFFLAGIGLHFNLATFRNWRTVWLTLLIVLVAVLSKFLGCGLASLRLGRKTALRVGVGMIPRGEVGMVVAQIGLSLGVIAQSIYDAVVFMSIATTLIAPPLLGLAYKEVTSREPAVAVEDRPSIL
ncbi:MAG TPA: cation:proton antiporter [Candidatus Sulfotelmatobacter sp.]|nr:cation:proton antiporter [Candidatus Sulfotelmatobacter sp.]